MLELGPRSRPGSAADLAGGSCLALFCASVACSERGVGREVDRNQELLTRIRQLQEREAGAEEKMQEQLERSRQCQQSLDATSKRLREKEDSLAQAGEVAHPLALASVDFGQTPRFGL
ncbi:Mitotic spindle assembly checkpoint protein MAD1 [Saguinus oedipus]|uniref:Mitotic spindle assembly checkpoint protein MAD1 n=1 Tax=Saguinus oedipus TaxID=9490 RepID=A0ABQ9W4K2_SAGOE|nr:Mitotic spindle assembly checkpoint protein MAD1 [Saguinus oedipus]